MLQEPAVSSVHLTLALSAWLPQNYALCVWASDQGWTSGGSRGESRAGFSGSVTDQFLDPPWFPPSSAPCVGMSDPGMDPVGLPSQIPVSAPGTLAFVLRIIAFELVLMYGCWARFVTRGALLNQRHAIRTSDEGFQWTDPTCEGRV